MLIVPLAVMGILELALRLGGYGYDTHFFKPVSLDGRKMLVENDSYGFRFFPPEVARLPRPILMAATKPADVYRIFVFGESAAEGDPDPAFGPARFLEVLLRERYPQQRFEVVNVAVTANNSHGILPIARECAAQQGDLWIIYMGNNEMIGPFGAAGAFGWKAPPVSLIRANLAVQQTRLGQLLTAGAAYLKSRTTTASEWGGLEMFASHHISPGDPAKARVYRNFQSNLDAILHAGLNSGAKVILNSVAVNLKDCPPLASESAPTLGASARSNFDRLDAQAKTAEAAGDPATAAKNLEQAAAIEPHNAGVQYRWGTCLLALGKVDAARAHLQLACDDDAVPVRTDSHINALIRQTVQAFASRENLVLLDTPSLLGANLGGICGNELFYEHVHFNPHGSYQLGLAWAAQVDSFLPPTLKSRLAGPWASPELCEHRLALTDWNRRNDLNEIVNRRHAAPLNGQSNNAAQLVELQNQLAEVSQRMDAAGVAQARQICVDALQRAPQDLDLHCNYADFLEAIGGIREAADQWQQVQRLRPDYYLGYFQAGRMQERLGQLDSARAAFQQSVAVHPFMAPAWFELSNIAASQGNLGLALQNVRRATQLQPHRPVYYACQGKLLGRMNRHADAIEQYRLALRVDPSYWDGHMALGGEWVDQENWAAAQTEFEAATQLRPDSIPAHLALGGVFARRGQVDAARREAAQVLQRDPGNPQAQSLLSQLPPE